MAWVQCKFSDKDNEPIKFSIPNNKLQNLRLAFCYNRLFEQDELMLNSYSDQGQQEQTQVIMYCPFTRSEA